MKTHLLNKRLSTLALALSLSALVACGGSNGPTAAVDLEVGGGTVATGIPLAFANITIRGANGIQSSIIADANGAYVIKASHVEGLTAPYILTATGASGDQKVVLMAPVAITLATNAAGTTNVVNINPMTNAVVALLDPNLNPNNVAAGAITQAAINTAVTNLVNAMGTGNLTAAGVPLTFNPITTVMPANGTGGDLLLEIVKIDITASGTAGTPTIVLTNLAAPDATTGNVPSTSLTAAAQTPPPLAPPTISTVTLSESAMVAIKMRDALNACLALPAATRGTYNGNVLSNLAPACQKIILGNTEVANETYLNSGYNLDRSWKWLISDAAYDGAQFSLPELQLSLSDTRKFVRINYMRADGSRGWFSRTIKYFPTLRTGTAPAITDSGWRIYGNQQIHDFSVESTLERQEQLNPNAPAATQSRMLSSIRVFFNPLDTGAGGPNGTTVAAVRIKGPGIPATGMTYTRSSKCGTDDFMAFANQTGAIVTTTVNGNNRLRIAGQAFPGSGWTPPVAPGSTSTFRAGTAYDFAQAQPWQIYDVEVFNVGNTTSTPSVILKTRMPAPLQHPIVGFANQWSHLDTATKTNLLMPSGANAGAATTNTLTWVQNPLSSNIDAAGMYSEAKVSNVFTSVGAGGRPAYNSSSLTINSTAQEFNSGCANAGWPALTTTNTTTDNSYRDAYLRTFSRDYVRKYNLAYWNN